jgi:hypothetical protein
MGMLLVQSHKIHRLQQRGTIPASGNHIHQQLARKRVQQGRCVHMEKNVDLLFLNMFHDKHPTIGQLCQKKCYGLILNLNIRLSPQGQVNVPGVFGFLPPGDTNGQVEIHCLRRFPCNIGGYRALKGEILNTLPQTTEQWRLTLSVTGSTVCALAFGLFFWWLCLSRHEATIAPFRRPSQPNISKLSRVESF